jgi:predicted HTH transcriptional regulator
LTEVEKYIKEGEHQKQDFKFRIDDQKKIARTLCAFANTDGGRLLIGVKDNGKIVGCAPEEERHMIEGAADVYCSPPVEIDLTVHQEGFRLVLEVKVPKAEKRKIQAPNEEGKLRSYFRRNDQTIEVNKILYRVWQHEDRVTNRPAVFDLEAREFLAFFTEEKMSLSQLYKKSNWSKKKVDDLLPKFVFWGLVEMDFEETRVTYSLPQRA